MKKSIILLTVIALAATGSYVVFAQRQMGGMMQKQDTGKMGMMMGEEMMEMCPMHMSMCQSMMSKQIVATQDGGVMAMVGNKLMKYDKDLKLVKETELKIDMEKMQQKMKEMMENCPMQKMMKQRMQGMQQDQ